jgi:hypothetical protein
VFARADDDDFVLGHISTTFEDKARMFE